MIFSRKIILMGVLLTQFFSLTAGALTCVELRKKWGVRRDNPVLEAATFLAQKKNEKDHPKTWEKAEKVFDQFYRKLVKRDPLTIISDENLIQALTLINKDGVRLGICRVGFLEAHFIFHTQIEYYRFNSLVEFFTQPNRGNRTITRNYEIFEEMIKNMEASLALVQELSAAARKERERAHRIRQDSHKLTGQPVERMAAELELDRMWSSNNGVGESVSLSTDLGARTTTETTDANLDATETSEVSFGEDDSSVIDSSRPYEKL